LCGNSGSKCTANTRKTIDYRYGACDYANQTLSGRRIRLPEPKPWISSALRETCQHCTCVRINLEKPIAPAGRLLIRFPGYSPTAIVQLRSQIASWLAARPRLYISGGKSGSARSWFARRIQLALGAGAMEAFVPVNCGAIPLS